MTDRRSAVSSDWLQTLPLLLALITWIIYCYWETASAMVAIWARSETYAHAFIVPPISLWLIWRLRHDILEETPRASLLLSIPVALTTFLWLLGELTAVNALTQFSLIATLVLAIMALLGLPVSKRIAFPLGFLFFSIPFGEFMLPKLMEWTAAFTVLALRSTGIPVYQEGLQFVIPSGTWSVVEACSGIRYIIASVTVGTLFAYLNYVSLRRRLVFIAVAAIIPIFANWLRAYMIVMLGHLSGNRLAAGVDHLIYGWLFFGLVIMIMFVIGSRWSEYPDQTDTVPAKVFASQTGKLKVWFAALGIALLATAGPLAFVAIDNADHTINASLARLAVPSNWTETGSDTSWKPAYVAPSAEFQASYAKNGKTVGIYIGYYRNQDYQHKLITSSNTLALSTDPVWSVVRKNTIPAPIEGMPSNIRIAELLGKDTVPETRLTAWQWYWINGKLTSSDAEAKLYTALSRLRGKGDDSAVIILYSPTESSGEILPAFASDAVASIYNLLSAARDIR